jgi:hypothetical protein
MRSRLFTYSAYSMDCTKQKTFSLCFKKSVVKMTEESLRFDLKEVKLDLQRAIVECSQRGLMHTTKW